VAFRPRHDWPAGAVRVNSALRRKKHHHANRHPTRNQQHLHDALQRHREVLLAILENFEGWERGADWNDLDFQHSHGNEIAKIGIVGEPRWEPEALVFAGAGFRRAPVKFFPGVANC
jgi:hypothetical protein